MAGRSVCAPATALGQGLREREDSVRPQRVRDRSGLGSRTCRAHFTGFRGRIAGQDGAGWRALGVRPFLAHTAIHPGGTRQ